MFKIVIITSAIVLVTIGGGIGLSIAHSSTQNFKDYTHNGFAPQATLARATPTVARLDVSLLQQAAPVSLPRTTSVSVSPSLDDAPLAEPTWEVAESTIGVDAFGSILAPGAGVRPQKRPNASTIALPEERPLVISSPMKKRHDPRKSRSAQAPAPVQIQLPIEAEMNNSFSTSYLIGVYR